MAKRKTFIKLNISDDERWEIHKELKSSGKILEANKLKSEILASYKWNKPCHHVSGETN